MRKFLISLLSLVILIPAATAQKMPKEDVIEFPSVGKSLCFHNLFQSNMVLQRNQPISIWGWAAAGEKVTVNFNGEELSAEADADRSWKVTFKAAEASSKPQLLIIKGSKKALTLENILIGDVWVLGGQSNMEFPISKVENGALEIASANFPQIRMLTIPAQNGDEMKKGFPRLHEYSCWFSRHFRKGDWEICSPKTVPELSAIGYVFARRLHMASQVPIGIIDASRGGTTVETWTPTPVLKTIKTEHVKNLLTEWDEKVAAFDSKKDLESRIEKHKSWIKNMQKQKRDIPANKMNAPTDLRPGPAINQNRPGNCYASMIAPIAGVQVKGAIFHQGFNNALGGSSDSAKMYSSIFPEMIKSWRTAFNNPKMPFGIISLCTAGDPQNRNNVIENMANSGPFIREAQYKTFLDLYKAGDKNIGFTSSYDLRRRWYHPQLKIPAGERMARWALATQYGVNLDWKPPMLKEMKAENGKLILYFDTNVRAVDDGPVSGFVIAGEDQKFQPADVDYYSAGKDSRGRPKQNKSILVLSSPLIAAPVHFRHAWARNPQTNLQAEGNKDLPLATMRSDNWDMEDARVLKKEYKLQDMRRKIYEAQQYLKQNEAKYEAELKKAQ